jgi:hypothetical protein
MLVHLLAQLDRELHRAVHQLVAFELHLAPRDVERGDDLQVGRGRGVREERLLERCLHGVEVLVGHHDDRALAQARHRLVHRVRLVDAHPGLVGVGQRPIGLFKALLVFGVPEHRPKLGRPAHRRAPAQEWREACEAEPRLVPQEDEIGLDRQALEHGALDVGDVAVEGAVRQHEHAHAVELALGLELLQRVGDRLDRKRAVHRVLREREGVDVQRLRAREHQAVVVRLVAVAVDEHDVARPAYRHVDDLVGGRGAVGDEEAMVAAESARRLVLRHLDVAGRLEQAVEAAGGGGGLGEEQVHAVELTHVADPVRLEDRLAARHRQRVEGADRPLRVLLQVVEVGRRIAIRDAVEDREVQLEHLLEPVEHAPDSRRFVRAGELADVAVGRVVDVELRANGVRGAREQHAEIAVARRGGLRQVGRDELAQIGQRGLRGVAEAVEHHDCLDVVVDEHCEHRVLEAADRDRLDHELVGVAPQLADALAHRFPGRALRRRNHQHFAVGLARLAAADGRRQDLRHMRVVLVLGLPRLGIVAVAVGEQRHADALCEAREACPLGGLEALVHLREETRSRIAAEILEGAELAEQRGELRAQLIRLSSTRQGLGSSVHLAPALHAFFGRRKESSRSSVLRRRFVHTGPPSSVGLP